MTRLHHNATQLALGVGGRVTRPPVRPAPANVKGATWTIVIKQLTGQCVNLCNSFIVFHIPLINHDLHSSISLRPAG